MDKLIPAIFLFLMPVFCAVNYRDAFIVWNVGQGQWLTLVKQQNCLHIDAGGEFAPLLRIKQVCRGKVNRLYLTHGDWDHIRYSGWLGRNLEACLVTRPLEKLSPRKLSALKHLKECPDHRTDGLTEVFRPHVNSKTKANSASRVFALMTADKRFLIPGDSTKKEERIWSRHPVVRGTEILVLGHHGSRTSTSPELLGAIDDLKQAVASARQKKYGHPHSDVLFRLHAARVPLVTTQQWGSLIFELE